MNITISEKSKIPFYIDGNTLFSGLGLSPINIEVSQILNASITIYSDPFNKKDVEKYTDLLRNESVPYRVVTSFKELANKQSETFSKFVFYSKSADKYPGKGTGEHLSKKEDYSELARIDNWRKVLSNFYICPFVHDNNNFLSAEHAYHYRKYKTISKNDIANKFIQSGSLGKVTDGAIIKAAAGKNPKKSLYIMNSKEINSWYGNSVHDALKEILFDKFTQCEKAKKVLLLTGNAELWHFLGRGKGNERWKFLEEIRETLRDF